VASSADTTKVPKTVLLADDSITIQRVVELAFAHQDVSVVSVNDGERAIESIRRSAPDLVLADIGMPGRTGYEVAEFVRNQPGLASVPVLLLAGAFESVDHAQARQVGADGILTKPFDPELLTARVNELLTGGRPAPQDSGRVEITPAAAVPSTIAPRSSAGETLRPPAIAEKAAPPEPSEVAPLPAGGSADTTGVAASSSDRPVNDTDRYFEQLDQKFAALAQSPWRPSPVAIDGVTPQEAPPAPPQGTTAPTENIPLTDAFTALLDAERSGEPGVPARLAAIAAPPPPPLDVNALADQIARKVLEQLSDRIVRETVAEIVGSTAERLVREEIERIKSNIK
jgi:CheY-like chemotaxis protein